MKTIILQNNTKCPDSLLLPVLRTAGCAAGADINGVLVRVNQGRRTASISGLATECGSWGRWANWTKTNGGTFSIVLPHWRTEKRRGLWPRTSALSLAEEFYWVAFHEWIHIRDFQSERRGARLEWDNRPARGRRIDTMPYIVSEFMGDTAEMSPREISLEIADSMIQARAAIDGGFGNYDTANDPEGYVKSILIAMFHHCRLNGRDIDAEIEGARAAFEEDLDEAERTPAREWHNCDYCGGVVFDT